MCNKCPLPLLIFKFWKFGYAHTQLRPLYSFSTFNAFHMKAVPGSTPVQLQCLHSGVWEPGNEAVSVICTVKILSRVQMKFLTLTLGGTVGGMGGVAFKVAPLLIMEECCIHSCQIAELASRAKLSVPFWSSWSSTQCDPCLSKMSVISVSNVFGGPF